MPAKFKERILYQHNPNVTLMRTTPEDAFNRVRDGGKAQQGERPRHVFLPLKGVSAITVEGQPFHEPEADAALVGQGFCAHLDSAVEVRELDTDINDPAFAAAMAEALHEQIRARAR